MAGRYNKSMVLSVSSSPVSIRCQGVLFDMDGILISSIASVERSWKRWAALRGLDPALARKVAHGQRAIDTLAALCPELDAEAETKVLEDYEIEDNEGLRVLPGVLAVARLAAGGIPTPGRLVTANQVTRGKPHPEPFVTGAALLGFAPRECVVFEDSSSGAKAGRAAGCTVVATTFSHPVERLEAAHYLVPDLRSVEVKADENGLLMTVKPLG